MPDFVICPIRDDDDLDELHAGDQLWDGESLVRTVVRSAGDAIFAFHVAEISGRVVGSATGVFAVDDNPTGTGRADVWVHPEARRAGIGTALWEFLQPRAMARGARRLTTRVVSTDDAALGWLAARGMTTGGLHLESTLALEAELPLIAPPPGVTVDTLPADADESIWRAVHAAHERLMLDTPDAETNPSPTPYAMYRALVAHPWQVCLATTDDGSIIGLTSVFPKNEKDGRLNTMITAVNQEWRGKGLATALKTAHAIRLRDAGWRAIVTQNMEGNDHILAANRRLGFQPSKAMLDAIYSVPDASGGTDRSSATFRVVG